MIEGMEAYRNYCSLFSYPELKAGMVGDTNVSSHNGKDKKQAPQPRPLVRNGELVNTSKYIDTQSIKNIKSITIIVCNYVF